MKKHHGQVAVIILLVSVVGLTLVLTVASQTISGLRRTEEIAESNRASACESIGGCTIGSTDFVYKTPAAITIPGQDQRILRIRALYNSTLATLVGVETSGGYNLPPQYETIVSLGQTGDVQRAVKATRSKPYLPAIFDYVLFSGSSTESLTK